MKRSPSPLARQQRHGFTLVELMVAMVGGLFVSIAVFTLAKHASGFSLRQSRIADATLQNVVGFERLRADISRAGFLSTPNIARDRLICPSTTAYPAALAQLASVFIDPVPAGQLSTEMTRNGIAPSRITLAGSYAASDLFPVTEIVPGTPNTVLLEPNSAGMVNIGYVASPTAATLATVFATGRALRVVDSMGRSQFAEIAGVTGGAAPAITLAATPPLNFRSGSAVRCGVAGTGEDTVVNVVNIVRYDLQNLSGDAAFTHMFRNAGLTTDATRRELIREELFLDGSVVPGSAELIAEYAVDLGFSLLVAPNTASMLTRVTGADVANYAGDPRLLPAGNGPQLIRAVHAWLSVRSQEADRTSNLPPVGTAPGPTQLRISLNPTNGALPPFARVRTLQSTIPLPNQARATWQ